MLDICSVQYRSKLYHLEQKELTKLSWQFAGVTKRDREKDKSRFAFRKAKMEHSKGHEAD